MSDVLTVREAAEELKVSVRTASRIFSAEPGVRKINAAGRGLRFRLRIPREVYLRVEQRMVHNDGHARPLQTRRHAEKCPHRAEGKAWKRCKCPVWIEGTWRGAYVADEAKGETVAGNGRRGHPGPQRPAHHGPPLLTLGEVTPDAP